MPVACPILNLQAPQCDEQASLLPSASLPAPFTHPALGMTHISTCVSKRAVGVAHYMGEPEDNRPLRLHHATWAAPEEGHGADGLGLCGALHCPAAEEQQWSSSSCRGHQSLTMSLQAFCHVMFMCVVAFAVVLAVTEGTKPIASR